MADKTSDDLAAIGRIEPGNDNAQGSAALGSADFRTILALTAKLAAAEKELERRELELTIRPIKCGDNILLSSPRVGCGNFIDDEIYRCVDCQTPFHRHCLKKHCEDELESFRAENARLAEALEGVCNRLIRCSIASGTTKEYAEHSVLRERTLLAAWREHA